MQSIAQTDSSRDPRSRRSDSVIIIPKKTRKTLILLGVF